jgi:hypothetical protein
MPDNDDDDDDGGFDMNMPAPPPTPTTNTNTNAEAASESAARDYRSHGSGNQQGGRAFNTEEYANPLTCPCMDPLKDGPWYVPASPSAVAASSFFAGAPRSTLFALILVSTCRTCF